MGMPKNIGVIDLMMGIPTPEPPRQYDFLRPLFRDKESHDAVRVPRASTCSRTCPKTEAPRRLRHVHARQDGPLRHRAAHDRRVARRARPAQRALKEHPDRFIPSVRRRPEHGHGRRARPRARRTRRFGIKAVSAFPCRLRPAGADQRQALLPDLRQVRRARHPDLLLRRRARARACRWRRRRSSCIDEVCWFFPELKFVIRHGCEPWTDLAVKLMLKWPNLYYSTSRLRPEALPEGDHRLRQHARRRQDHLRRLLPDGPLARAHLRRHAERAVQGRGVAEVPARATRSAC